MKKQFLFISSLISFLLAACGVEVIPATPTLDPQIQQGKNLFSENCAACHGTEPDMVIVGPSLVGIAEIADTRIEGLEARQYIENSIMYPDDYLVEGYEDLMPKTFGKTLTREEVNLLVEYLLTLE